MFSDTKKLYVNTNPIDKDTAADAVKELYRYCNTCASIPSEFYKDKISPSRNPDIVFVDGPKDLLVEMKFHENNPFHASAYNSVAHFVSKRGWGATKRMRSVIGQIFEIPRDGYPSTGLWETPMMLAIDYLYGSKERVYENQWEEIATKIWDNSYLIFTFVDVCYIVNRPERISFNDMGFHCKDGPSLVFRDGTEIYCYEGIKVDKDHLLHPKSMTLKDIHQKNSRKHYLIDMVGLDHYLGLVKAWGAPETEGRFKKFFGFADMVLPGDDEPEDIRIGKKRGYGSSYKDRAYEVDIYLGEMNGEYGITFQSKVWKDTYHIPYKSNPFDLDYISGILEPEDKELWELFDLREVFSRGCTGLRLSYQNKEFRLKSDRLYEHPSCRHDLAPAWFKAKMFRNESALYETEHYAIKWEDGALSYAGELPNNHNSLFGGCENLPSYKFDIDLVSNSWAGLLKKWAELSFSWLCLHEDSTRMP
jgi:hypothetical protein